MGPLLQRLQSSQLGLSINEFYAGGFIHADDICTISSSVQSLKRQMDVVKGFVSDYYLKLNVNKCEIVVFDKHGGQLDDTVEINGCCVESGAEAKCLGYWWSSDLFATKSVDENIQKARRAFFHFGSIGVFQGDLSPLSTKSVIETCVVPILLYGSENWILTDGLLQSL